MNIEFEQVFVDTFSIYIPFSDKPTYEMRLLKKFDQSFRVGKNPHGKKALVHFSYLNCGDLNWAKERVKQVLTNVSIAGLLDFAEIGLDISYDTEQFKQAILTRGWEASTKNPSEFIKKNNKTRVKYYSKKAEVERRDNKWLKRKLANEDRMTQYPIADYDFWRLEISGSPKTNQEVDDLVRNFKKLIK